MTTKLQTPKREWYVIGRGLAGWHASGINVTSSGGTLEDGVYWTGVPTSGYLSGAVDGCLIYDAENADADAFAKFIISGPMCNPALGPDEADRFTDRYAARQMMPGLEGAFKTIATLAQDENYGGLDYVGVAVYRALLARVPGIKLGTVSDGVIVWDAPASQSANV